MTIPATITMKGTPMTDHYLYGRDPDDENLELDPESVYETWADDNEGWDPSGSFEIIEWTAKPLGVLLPTAKDLLDRICEWYIDEECGFEAAPDVARNATADPKVLDALQAALDAFDKAMGDKWLTADRENRRLKVTWDEGGQPLLDGRPMYVPAKQIPGQEAPRCLTCPPPRK